MSILNYFSRRDNTKDTPPAKIAVTLPSREESGVSTAEFYSIQETLQPERKRTRCSYKEEDKTKIAKYACTYGTANALRHFKKDFPKLSESTLRPWLDKYKTEIKTKPSSCVIISEKRGRPLLLPTDLDEKLRLFISNVRTAGGTIDKHVVCGILMGLLKVDLHRYGAYLDFVVTKGWLQSLYKRMNLSRRMVTTSRPVVTKALWEEIRTQFLHDIVSVVMEHEIPDELILNIDQTPSKFVPTANITMAETGTKHVPKKGGNDKRGITVTLTEALDGKILPFQLIYTGKTERSLPSIEFPTGFCLRYNANHWSNEEETIRLLVEVVEPYLLKVKEEHGLPVQQKSLIIWDAFKAQSTAKVYQELERMNVVHVMVPKNMTHLLQPLDLTTNGSMKKMEKKNFSDYFSETITREMTRNPHRDVTTIEVDLKLSTLKPIHGKLMKRVYEFLQSPKGREIISAGWRASGIEEAITVARQNGIFDLDPFAKIVD